MPGLRKPEQLVVDANPILSALLGGKARRIFFEAGIQEFAVPEGMLNEVRAYLPQLALQLRVGAAFLEYALELLPLRQYPKTTYRGMITEARHQIGHRDPGDVDVLALTLQLGVPLWSNDRDFEGTNVTQLTTARLVNMFFGPSSR